MVRNSEDLGVLGLEWAEITLPGMQGAATGFRDRIPYTSEIAEERPAIISTGKKSIPKMVLPVGS